MRDGWEEAKYKDAWGCPVCGRKIDEIAGAMDKCVGGGEHDFRFFRMFHIPKGYKYRRGPNRPIDVVDKPNG